MVDHGGALRSLGDFDAHPSHGACRQWGAAAYTAGVCAGVILDGLNVATVDAPSGTVGSYPEGAPVDLLGGLTLGGTGNGALRVGFIRFRFWEGTGSGLRLGSNLG